MSKLKSLLNWISEWLIWMPIWSPWTRKPTELRLRCQSSPTWHIRRGPKLFVETSERYFWNSGVVRRAHSNKAAKVIIHGLDHRATIQYSYFVEQTKAQLISIFFYEVTRLPFGRKYWSGDPEVSNLTSICRSNEACIWLNQNRWFCSWAALTPGRGSMILLFSQIYWRRTFLVRHESSILSWFSGAVTLSSCSQTFSKMCFVVQLKLRTGPRTPDQ